MRVDVDSRPVLQETLKVLQGEGNFLGDGIRDLGCIYLSKLIKLYKYSRSLLLYVNNIPWASLGDSVVKNPPAIQEMQETWVQSLRQEDPWRRK